MRLTNSVHVSCDIQAGDIVIWDTLEPHRLPDTSAGGVKDVREPLGLLSLWDALIVSRIENKDMSVID
jgi:hypothetical protein